MLNSPILLVRAMLDRARSVQSCEKSLQAANEAFYTTSCAWLDAERNGVKSLAGRAFDENESILQPTEHVSATLSAAVQLLNAKVSGVSINLWFLTSFRAIFTSEILSTLASRSPPFWSRS